MKKKNRINPLEAHLEKLVLCAVSVVLLAVVAMQFLTRPNAVQIGNEATPVAPDRIYEKTKSDAERLLAQMQTVTPDIEIPQQTVTTSIEELTGIPAASSIRVTSLGGAETGIEGRDFAPGAGDASSTTYVLPALPSPRVPVAAPHRGTVDPFEVVFNDDLRPFLPAQQPYDLAAVSVEGLVDATGLLSSLQDSPDGDTRAIPLSWWRGNVNLLGIEAEREEMSPTGSWGNATVIAGTPGGFDVLSEARSGELTPVELIELGGAARESMRDIAQPSFPNTVAGTEWVRPSERVGEAGMSEDQLEIQRLERQLARFDDTIARLEEQLGLVGQDSGGRSGNERGVSREGGGGGGAGGQDRQRRLEEQRRDGIQRNLDQAYERRDRVIDQLFDLGVTVGLDEDDQRDEDVELAPLPQLLDATELPVWLHDLSAEPGKTYRYRLRVVINNPLYQRGQFLSESQRAEADSAVREGPWSAWTDPVEMEADQQYFVVSASEDDAMGSGPKAQVEVFEFYYGYWRKASTSLEPGDSIRASAKLPENLLIWDQETLEAGAPPAQGRPGVRPGNRPGDPRQREVDPYDRERRMIEESFDERGRQAQQPRTRRTAQDDEDGLPEGAIAGPKNLAMSVNATLLDVVRVPGEDNLFEAILRAPDGSLMVQRAARAAAGPLYARLAASAREGEEQNRPEPDEAEDNRPIPFEDRIPGREEEDVRGPGGG